MLDLGFVSAILPDQSFEAVIDFAAANDFKCVEVMCWPKGKAERRYAGVTHIDIDTLNDAKISYIQSYLKEKGVYASALGYYPNPLDPDDAKSKVYVDHIKDLIYAAKKLGFTSVNSFGGRNAAKTVEWNIGRFKEVWTDIIKIAEENYV